MYIVWRKRPVKGNKKALFLQDGEFSRTHPDCDVVTPWKPLGCEHRGEGRVAWTPLLMYAERRDGEPRQKLLHRLPTIRSCCIADPFPRAAWWYDVEQTIRGWQESNDFEHAYGARDERAILAKLRAVVPRPTRAGLRDFAMYRRWREREHHARLGWIDPESWRAQEEATRPPDERPDEAWRRAESEWRRYEQVRTTAESSARQSGDAWARRPPDGLAGREERGRRAEADWARFEQARREHEARYRRWAEGQERRRQEEGRRAGGQRWGAAGEPSGRKQGPLWYEVLGLAPAATRDEIKRRYRELAMQHHPDKGGDEKQFIRINAAHKQGLKQAVV